MFKRKKRDITPIEDGVSVSLNSLLLLRAAASRLSLTSLSKAQTILAGNQASRIRGRGIDFSEVRAYQPGDDVRHIDWRVTARTGKPHTKIFQEDRERPLYIITDYSPPMLFGTQVCFKSVVAAKLSALYAFAAVKRGDRVGSFIFSGRQCQEFPTRAGMSGVLPFIKALTGTTHQLTQQETPGALANTLKRLRRVIKPGSLVTICSDFTSLDSEAKRHLNQLRAHNDIILNFIYDPLEVKPPPPNQYAITNGEDVVNIDTHSSDLCKNYQAHFVERFEQLKHLSRSRNMPLILCSTQNDVAQCLIKQIQRVEKGCLDYELS